MNILFITPSFPSDKERIRALSLIKQLSKRHGVFLLSLVSGEVDTRAVRPYCKKIYCVRQPKWRSWLQSLLFLFTPLPLEVAYCRNKKMERMVGELIKEHKINLLYVKRLRSLQWVRHSRGTPVFIDSTDAMSLFYKRVARRAPLYKKPLYYEEALKYSWYEKKMLARFRNWILCSPVDLEYLREHSSDNALLHLIPNSVDTDVYKTANISPYKNTILISGLMNKFINSDAALYFVKEILPLVKNNIPDVHMTIAGPKPSARVRALASPSVSVIGEVDDMARGIAHNEVVVAPIRVGAGTSNKVLQAWSVGRPLVSTSIGVRGIKCKYGEHVLIADSAQEFANALLRVFRDKALQKSLVQNGQKLVNSTYSADAVGVELERVIGSIR
jgi:polysaccharide biosynthesis protein PslH